MATFSVNAFPSNEFLAIGINEIDPDNVIYVPGSTFLSGCIKTIAPFKVNSGQNYYLCSKEYSDIVFGDATITEYDLSKERIKDSTINRFWNNRYLDFTITNDTFYISFSITIFLNKPSTTKLYDINNYCLIQNQNISIDDFKYYLKEYPNLFDYISPENSYPVIDDGYVINSYMSMPLTLNFLYDNILVYDKIDGDISNKKRVISNNYDENKLSPGIFSITYRAINSLGTEARVTVNIKVIDDVFPVITGPNTIVTTNTSFLNLDEFKTSLIATDNYDGVISDNIIIQSDDYTLSKDNTGEYNVTFSVKDSSGNLTIYPVKVIVEEGDFTPPVINGDDVMYTDVNSNLGNNDIISKYTAIDDIDGDISKNIVIIRNEYMYNKTKRGLYNVTLEVTDSHGNQTTKIVTIVNMETEVPVFLLSPLFVTIKDEMNLKNYSDIINFLVDNKTIDDNNYVITYEDFLINQNEEGNHLIQLRKIGNTEDINIIMNVKKENEVKPSFSYKVKSFFKNIYSSIKSFFRWVFS